MTLPYDDIYDEYSKEFSYFENGFFINNIRTGIKKIDPDLTGHDSDKIFRVFEYWFNPDDRNAPYSKNKAVEALKGNIKYILNLEYMTFNDYIELKLYQYFLQVYKSENTKIRENGKDVVELFETTGYQPEVFYCKDSDSYSWDLPKRLMFTTELMEILKSILVQSCSIDSLELALSRYKKNLSKTILTSKFNPYETFYNFYLMDYNIQTVPQRIFNTKTQKFEEYSQSDFFIPDSEIRYKDEIESIKRLVPLKDRHKYFR